MFRFLAKDMAVNIPEEQIKEAILHKHIMNIKLYNLATIELINENEGELYKIFTELQAKTKFGNFIDMR